MREQANNPMESAFDETLELLFREEQKLRFQSEQQVRAYARLMLELARELVPGELDRRQHADPNFVSGLGPEGWRKVLQDALVGNVTGRWGDQSDTQAIVQSQAALAQAQATIHALEEQIGVLKATLKAKPVPAEGPQAELEESVAAVGAVDTAQLEQSSALVMPAVPAYPPGPYQGIFNHVKQWERVATALAVLAVTGWSMRLGVVALIAKQLGVTAQSGTVRRVINVLTGSKLWAVKPIDLQVPKLANQITLVRLTDTGKEIMQAIGVTPVQSEWELLRARHNGLQRTGLVCAFAYHARLRGYAAEVGPSVPRPVAPDVALRQGDKTLYAGVETESGDVGHRLSKWRDQIDLQGLVAISTLTPEMQVHLVNEAKSAGARHGKATNLPYLFAGQKQRGPLWALEW